MQEGTPVNIKIDGVWNKINDLKQLHLQPCEFVLTLVGDRLALS